MRISSLKNRRLDWESNPESKDPAEHKGINSNADTTGPAWARFRLEIRHEVF